VTSCHGNRCRSAPRPSLTNINGCTSERLTTNLDQQTPWHAACDRSFPLHSSGPSLLTHINPPRRHADASDPDVSVASVSAALTDARAVKRLLAAIPHSRQIRPHLSETFFFHHWDDRTQRAFWVTSDGSCLRCVTVTGLTAFEMVEIVTSDSYGMARAAFAVSPQVIRSILEAEMDIVVMLIN
jgi:hypothetical protein